MKKSFKDCSVYMKTGIITICSGAFVGAIFLTLGICNVLPIVITFGILMGSTICGAGYIFQDKITYLNCDDSKKLRYTMLVMFASSLFLVILGALIMILHFTGNEEAFKIVGLAGLGFLGSYLYTTIVYAIVYFGSKKCE